MTARVLIDAFETMADAPNGVELLRDVVLQLAVRGKLVAQESNDGSAGELLALITKEAESGPKSRARVQLEGELPFAAPHTWEWVRLGNAMNLVNGKAFKSADWGKQGLPIVRIQNLNNESAPFNFCSKPIDQKFHISNGDLLLSWSGTPGTSFGAFIWARGDALLNQHIFRCDLRGGAYSTEFVRMAINSRLNVMIDRAHGAVGLRHVTRGVLDGLWLPLPPLAEQHRIVAKVDELMSLLDRLEAARDSRDTTRASLRDAALQVLQDAEDVEEVQAAWSRISENMDELFTDPDDVGPLRQTVLQLAIKGRLVAQNQGEGSAAAAMSAVSELKGRLKETGEIRKSKEVPDIDPTEYPFKVPDQWIWSRLDACTMLITDGEHQTPPRDPSGPVPLATAKNVRDGYIDLTVTDFVTEEVASLSWNRCRPQRDDILIVCVGATTGRMAIMKDNEPMVLVRSVAVLRPAQEAIHPDFLAIVLRSPLGQKQIWGRVKQSAQPCLYLGKMKLIMVPVPPLEEQIRIVTQVSECLLACDRLHRKLTMAEESHSHYASSASHQMGI